LAKRDDTARQELRDLLGMLRDALGQPPLSVKLRLCMEGVMDLLGEKDIAKRMATRDRLDDALAELEGR
jgi:hypothetical protein